MIRKNTKKKVSRKRNPDEEDTLEYINNEISDMEYRLKHAYDFMQQSVLKEKIRNYKFALENIKDLRNIFKELKKQLKEGIKDRKAYINSLSLLESNKTLNILSNNKYDLNISYWFENILFNLERLSNEVDYDKIIETGNKYIETIANCLLEYYESNFSQFFPRF